MPRHRYRQRDPNGCGPSVLMVACKELDCTQFTIPDFTPGGTGNVDLDIDLRGNNLSTEETKIHFYTGNHRLNYSMPGRIASVAGYAGLDAQIYLDGCCCVPLLKRGYPQAINEAADLGYDPIYGPPGALEENQRRLFVCVTAGGGLHYIMERPDASFMDPADGEDITWIRWKFKFQYAETGVSVVVTGP